ncbi:IclR family transcriptional regulator [Haladaptatus caseinilyticus]|uniref:IclR family transcriptional regulator n=1 Tax=Haladaptatus caseinilyticus TaxID=2993314 RepID=UPI00224AD448|nr:IclR family transcriptional regulator C-terminal domain-containing protein [Haladaptatus caseinilyticus]
MNHDARNREQLHTIAKPVVDEFANETGERVAIAQKEYGRAGWLYYSESSEAVTTDAHIGIDLDLYCTAIGKIILAFNPEPRTNELLADCTFKRRTDNTATDRKELLDELRTIRERGVAFDDEERLEGVRGIAVPVHNRADDVLIGGLTIAGATTRLKNDWYWEELPDLLSRAANMIEVNFNYR